MTTKVNVDGVELDLEMVEGFLNIYKDGKLHGGVVLFEPEPEVIPEPTEIFDDGPEVLPAGWYRRPDDILMMDGFYDQEAQKWIGGRPVSTTHAIYLAQQEEADSNGSE